MLVFCQPAQSLWKENIMCIWNAIPPPGKNICSSFCVWWLLICEITQNMIKGGFNADVWNTVKYIQMSSVRCPARKRDEKNIKMTLLPLLTLGANGCRVTVANQALPRQFEEAPETSLFEPKRPGIGWKDGGSLWESQAIPREKESSATFQLHRCQINTQHNLVGDKSLYWT